MTNASLKAVILAAGKGTRMKHLTAELPKPMLHVAGRPVLEHIVRGLTGAGITELCIITGYRAEAIESHFGDGRQFGARIAYARQTTQDGTGKAPELAREFVGPDNFLLIYGDILADPRNYPAMLSTFRDSNAAALITVRRGEDVTKGAAVTLDAEFFMLDLVEKPPPGSVRSPWYNAGVYLFTPLLFQYTARLEKSPRGEYELPDSLRAMRADGHPIKAMELTGYWIDVRDPQMLSKAEQLLAR
jgi:NDP-sugar pyrophosphorylase family protein